MLGRFTAVAAAIALALNFSAARAAHAGASDTPPDFSGAWKLDPSKSDMPARPDNGGRGGGGHGGMFGGGDGGGGRRGGGGGGGGGGGYGRHGGGDGDASGTPPDGASADAAAGGAAGARGGHMGFLPSFVRIAQTSSEIEFADSAGTEVREIALVAAPYDSNATQPKVPRDPGEWNKSKLDVEKMGPGDLKIREEFSLEDAGQTLVVKTHLDGGRSGSRDIKRVYRKANAS